MVNCEGEGDGEGEGEGVSLHAEESGASTRLCASAWSGDLDPFEIFLLGRTALVGRYEYGGLPFGDASRSLLPSSVESALEGERGGELEDGK